MRNGRFHLLCTSAESHSSPPAPGTLASKTKEKSNSTNSPRSYPTDLSKDGYVDRSDVWPSWLCFTAEKGRRQEGYLQGRQKRHPSSASSILWPCAFLPLHGRTRRVSIRWRMKVCRNNMADESREEDRMKSVGRKVENYGRCPLPYYVSAIDPIVSPFVGRTFFLARI